MLASSSVDFFVDKCRKDELSGDRIKELKTAKINTCRKFGFLFSGVPSTAGDNAALEAALKSVMKDP